MKKTLLSACAILSLGLGAMAQVPTTGLLVHHDFNNNLSDNSGNGYDLSFDGASYTTGLGGDPMGAITTSTATDKATFDTDVTMGADFTVSVWFKVTEDRYSQVIVGDYIACQTGNTGYSILYYGTPAQSSPRLRFQVGNQNIEIAGDLNDSEWHHAVLVIESGVFAGYLDNVMGGGKATTATNSTSDSHVGWGAKTSDACGDFNSMNFTGAIDELRIYDVALNNNAIDQLYNNGDGVILCSSFTGNANDESGNDLHGTVKNNAGLTDGLNDELNGAYTFPGSTSHIDYGDSVLFTSEFSVSVWFKLTEDRYVQNIVGNHVHCSFIDKGFGIWHYGTGAGTARLRFQLGNSNYEEAIELADNLWHQAVFVIGSSEAKAYLDGVEVGTVSNTYTVTTEPLVVGYQETVGSGCGLGNPTNTTGAIDNLKIYSRTISATEILEDYDTYVITAGSEVVETENFSVFPNPTSGMLNIQGSEFTSFEVLSAMGTMVLDGTVTEGSIDVSTLNTGSYTLKLTDAYGTVKATSIVVQ